MKDRGYKEEAATPQNDELDNLLAEFLDEYEKGYDTAKRQGHNIDYHTYESKVAFLDALTTWADKRPPDFSNVNRVEVINHTKNAHAGGGRTVVAWEEEPLDVSIELQDDNRTLKLFVGFTTGEGR